MKVWWVCVCVCVRVCVKMWWVCVCVTRTHTYIMYYTTRTCVGAGVGQQIRAEGHGLDCADCGHSEHEQHESAA